MKVKLASWNVNGIRAVTQKQEWNEWFNRNKYDIIGLQETKASIDQLPKCIKEQTLYPHTYFASSIVKKGYSGTGVFSKLNPLSVEIELPDESASGEGRIVHLEFEKFHYFNGYFPNGGAEILDENEKPTGEFKRVPYKMNFFDVFFNYAQKLRQSKPIVVCGDFNIAHKEIDLARPKANTKNTGFLPIERAFLDKFVEHGYIDTFRHVHQDITDKYSWWSYKAGARKKNVGWRIDYFFVSNELKDNIVDAYIEDDVYGSDHCPVCLELDI